MTELIELRRKLHSMPEVSGKEEQTARNISEFLSDYHPDQLIEGVGGAGVLAIFEGCHPGPTVAVRCELDALPIKEINKDLPHKSINEGVSHKCGHDGHMTIVAGLAKGLSQNRPKRGKVVLLFQPAEETGEGARAMLGDVKFNVAFDYCFALHNLPGYELGEIVIRDDIFSAASKGFIINLHGKTSHAAEPENGISPDLAIGEIIGLIKSATENIPLEDFGLCTVVHAKLGSPSFGISPGEGTVMATIRAYRDEDLNSMEDYIRRQATSLAKKYRLGISFEEREVFKSTINDDESNKFIASAANKYSYKLTKKREPFRWSEDFGEFSQRYKGAMFGLGAGFETPELHNPDYDFPDELIERGINMFETIIDRILND